MPSGRKPGKKAQPVIPACSEPSAHRSIQRWGAGSLTVPCLASQLRVKLGMIRPPTTEIRTTIAARPRRHPRLGGTSKPPTSRCIRRSAMERTATGKVIGRLRQFRPAAISRATAAVRITGNERSATAATQKGIQRRNQAGDAAEQPQGGEPCQRRATNRQPAGPVRNCGQHEPRNGREDKSKQHLVNVPGQWIKPAGQRHARQEHSDPQNERQCGPEAGRQKEGAEGQR